MGSQDGKQYEKEKNEILDIVKKTLTQTMWISFLVSLGLVSGGLRSCDTSRMYKKIDRIEQGVYIQRGIQEGVAREVDIDTNGTIDYIAGDRIFLRNSQDSVDYIGYKIKDYRKKISSEIEELEIKIDGLYKKGTPNTKRQSQIEGLEKKKETLQKTIDKLTTFYNDSKK